MMQKLSPRGPHETGYSLIRLQQSNAATSSDNSKQDVRWPIAIRKDLIVLNFPTDDNKIDYTSSMAS